jgi:predicted nucleotide-binding protein (sugar kinase/HSP70/actin superfamily)
MATIFWNGEPLLYRRVPQGHGLIMGGRSYRFDAYGNLEALDSLNPVILQMVLARLYGDQAGTMFAVHAQTEHQRRLAAATKKGK